MRHALRTTTSPLLSAALKPRGTYTRSMTTIPSFEIARKRRTAVNGRRADPARTRSATYTITPPRASNPVQYKFRIFNLISEPFWIQTGSGYEYSARVRTAYRTHRRRRRPSRRTFCILRRARACAPD